MSEMHPEIQPEMQTKILIDKNLCVGDELCLKVCPTMCFRMKEGKAATVPMAGAVCIGCGHCVAVCPKAAISLNGVDPRSLPKAGAQKDSKGAMANVDDLEGLIKSRRSIRQYKAQDINREDLLRALEISRYAPTGKNSQDIEWIIISGRAKVMNLAEKIIEVMRSLPDCKRLTQAHDQGLDPIFRHAPCVIFAHCEKDNYALRLVDAGIACGYLDLTLNSLGLGACWAGYAISIARMNPQLLEDCGLPPHREITGGLMVGYPSLRYQRIPSRKPLRLTWA